MDAGELQAFEDALQQHGLRCVRPRPGITDERLPFPVTGVPWSTLGRFVSDSQIRPGGLLSFAAGDYAVQDAASLLPLTLMELQDGQRVIDCCAAPGGKSAAVLEQLRGTGVLVSNEVIASRVDTLQLTLARTGQSNYLITNASVERLALEMDGEFDCVLVDAPCTGQSLVARGKQSLSAFSAAQIAHSAARQRTILESAVRLVRPGGRLIYSTCTFAYDENEGNVRWLRELLPGWQMICLPELERWQVPDEMGCYRLWPHRDHCAGGFAAALVRPMDLSAELSMRTDRPAVRGRRRQQAHSSWQPIDFRDQLQQWGRAEAAQLYQQRSSVCWFSPRIPVSWYGLAYRGVELAQQFGQHWQPAWPLAVLECGHQREDCLPLDCSPAGTVGQGQQDQPTDALQFEPRERTELSDAEAISYFTGTSLHGYGQTGPTDAAGWMVAHWRGRPLGWAKRAAGQLKNHLPKPLRHPTLSMSPSPPQLPAPPARLI